MDSAPTLLRITNENSRLERPNCQKDTKSALNKKQDQHEFLKTNMLFPYHKFHDIENLDKRDIMFLIMWNTNNVL